jgi:transposase
MNYYLSKLMTYHQVHQMERDGFSIQRIAGYLGMNWRTAKRLLSLTEQEYLLEQEIPTRRKSSLRVYEGFVKDKLQLHPGTPSAQMHDWLKERHQDFPVFNPKTVFNFVQAVRVKYNIPKTEKQRDYVCVPELPYGLQAQVDFGFYNMATTLGRTKKVQFFTFVLSRSRYKYLLFSDTPFTTATVIAAHELAFQAIKGCPVEIVYDQDRLFMVSENLGDIVMTSEFRSYVSQSSFITHFCRKADPESKGKVENVVKYVKQNFLYNRSFKDLETLNDEAHDWLIRTGNALHHGATRKIPAEEYQIEMEFLHPWHPVITAPETYPLYSVHKDNKISYKSNVYSVPLGTYQGKGTTIFLKVTLDQLIIINHKEEEICRHDISRLKGQKILARDHGRDKKVAIAEMMGEFSELMENKMQALNWVSQIQDHKPRYIRDQIQLLKATVTGLDPHIASRALEYACQHQIVSATDFKAITEALKREQAGQSLPDPKIIQLNPLSGQTRKNADTTPGQSDLGTYDSFFNSK